jgi:hypothetical protein
MAWRSKVGRVVLVNDLAGKEAKRLCQAVISKRLNVFLANVGASEHSLECVKCARSAVA